MRTLKYFLISVFCLLQFISNAQDTIPGASKQPSWVFPVWIEDATGQKDTIYFGYDSEAGEWGDNIDTAFGEKWVKQDTTKFMAAVYSSFGGSPDSILQVDVRSGTNLRYNILLLNVTAPVTLKWNVNLFHSDSLPFQDIDPSPRAQGELWFGNGTLMSTEGCDIGRPIVITDTADSLYAVGSCVMRDSASFYDLFNNTFPQYEAFFFDVLPWRGKGYWKSVKENRHDNLIKIYPNPAHSVLQITSDSEEIETIELYDLTGRLLYNENINFNRA